MLGVCMVRHDACFYFYPFGGIYHLNPLSAVLYVRKRIYIYTIYMYIYVPLIASSFCPKRECGPFKGLVNININMEVWDFARGTE